MLTEVKTAADLAKLPQDLRLSLRSVGQTPMGVYAYRTKAERKANIQLLVAKYIREHVISLELGVEILQTNDAYGPKGKAALREFVA